MQMQIDGKLLDGKHVRPSPESQNMLMHCNLQGEVLEYIPPEASSHVGISSGCSMPVNYPFATVDPASMSYTPDMKHHLHTLEKGWEKIPPPVERGGGKRLLRLPLAYKSWPIQLRCQYPSKEKEGLTEFVTARHLHDRSRQRFGIGEEREKEISVDPRMSNHQPHACQREDVVVRPMKLNQSPLLPLSICHLGMSGRPVKHLMLALLSLLGNTCLDSSLFLSVKWWCSVSCIIGCDDDDDGIKKSMERSGGDFSIGA
ncbi:hypothetical protein ACMFMG_001801 [Clarireedia jacksonii]